MIRRLLNGINREIKGLHEAAYYLVIFTFFSHILGLIRDKVFAHSFGAGEILDTYYASFRVPDLVFVTVASLVSVSVLVPFLIRERHKGEAEEKKIVRNVWTVFLWLMLIIISLVMIFVPQLLSLLVPGIYAGANQAILITMTRVLLLSPLFLGVSNLLSSINQSRKIFIVTALSPIFYNLSIIIGTLCFYPKFGLLGLTFGVVIGSLLHLAIQLPSIPEWWKLLRPVWKIDWRSIKSVLMLSIPRTISLASGQLLMTALYALASLMAIGSIAVLTLAYNVQSVPLSIIGVSYSLAAFPTLSKLYATGKREEFIANLTTALKHILFWSIPITIFFIVERAQIVRVLFGSGEFSWSSTRLVAAALALFVISVSAKSLELLFLRGFYSAGQTKKPLIIVVTSSILGFILAFLGVRAFDIFPELAAFFERVLRVSEIGGTAVLALPLGFSLAAIMEMVWLWREFEKEFSGLFRSAKRVIFDSLLSSFLMGFTIYIGLNLMDDVVDMNTFWGVLTQGFVAGIIGLMVWVIVLIYLRNPEWKVVIQTLQEKFWKKKTILPEATEL